MSLVSGDPLFKRPSRNTSSFYTPLEASDLEASDSVTGRPIPPVLGESSTRDSLRNPDGSNSSPSAASKAAHSGDGASSTGHFSMPTPQLVAKNHHVHHSTGEGNKPFALGHSRNSSDQSVRSKASAGYGSLPSHSRQGSSDDGNNVTVRLVLLTSHDCYLLLASTPTCGYLLLFLPVVIFSFPTCGYLLLFLPVVICFYSYLWLFASILTCSYLFPFLPVVICCSY